ncbi:hypothetical protein DERF_006045 [Dermatophagoides farinae]|uniref:Uncharacterized protein n=1 Tax=Dermatophagoides farinae TaxID=6954 RepID=A0A922I9K0_DERFA|nr:hypothetical protein DERF_006045 [Dermatophagoides farinae]
MMILTTDSVLTEISLAEEFLTCNAKIIAKVKEFSFILLILFFNLSFDFDTDHHRWMNNNYRFAFFPHHFHPCAWYSFKYKNIKNFDVYLHNHQQHMEYQGSI